MLRVCSHLMIHVVILWKPPILYARIIYQTLRSKPDVRTFSYPRC